MTDDLRSIADWSPTASAGVTTHLEWVAEQALTSLAVYLGGSERDADDLTEATAHAATLGDTMADGTVVGSNRVATVELPVPATNSTPIRLVVDGGVKTYGRLFPKMHGRKDLDVDGNSFSLAPAVAASFSLSVLGTAIATLIDGGDATSLLSSSTIDGGNAATTGGA